MRIAGLIGHVSWMECFLWPTWNPVIEGFSLPNLIKKGKKGARRKNLYIAEIEK
jgi:hypothetical protein